MKKVIAMALASLAATPLPPIPTTPQRPITDTYGATTLVDPYRWLEGDAHGNTTPEVASWTDAQNARTRSVLDHLPGRPALEARLRRLMEVTSIGLPSPAGPRYFYRKRTGTQNQPVLYVRDSLDGEDHTLLDPNTLDDKGLVTLAWFKPSHDGSLLAFGLYRAGDENAVCHLLDTSTGKWLPDQIPGKVQDVDWLPDHTGFLYRRLADLKKPYSGQIRFHTLGNKPDADPLLFEQYKEGPLATTWGPEATLSHDGRWVALSYHTSTKSNDLYAIDFDLWRRTGQFTLIEITKGQDARFQPLPFNDTFYVQTTLDAPNGRILAIDPRHPDPAHWRTLVPERKDAAIDSFEIAQDALIVTYQHNATTIDLLNLDGSNRRSLPLPGIGSADLSTLPDRAECFLRYTSFNTPPTIYRLDLATSDQRIWQRPDVPIDPDSVQVDQVWYPSKDRTRVSMFFIHKKGLPLNGQNPTILYGYGGFGIGMNPYFSATLFPWLESGGLYAVANLRGGSEYGESWHAAGMLDQKQNVFDDFIAAAQYLIANQYTSPAHLGIAGGSNGGLLTGAVAVQRPDLVAAAYVAVPLLDMLRYQHFLMARYWVPEYGSSEDPAQFPYLLKYSPYHNINPATHYPAIFLTAGENDARVHPMHARKMAARLQATTAPSPNPTLLWIDRDAGHGQGKPLDLQLRDTTDEYIFFQWRLGLANHR